MQFGLGCGQAGVAINKTLLKFTGIRNADVTGHLSRSSSRAVRVDTQHPCVHWVVFRLGLSGEWNVARTLDEESILFWSAFLGFSFLWGK